MPRYLIVDDSDTMGGGQAFAVRLASEVPAVVLSPAGSALERRCTAAGIETRPIAVPPFTLTASPRFPAAARAFRALLRSATRDDVIVSNTPRASAFLAAANTTLRVRPRVVHVLHQQETAAQRSARFVLARFGGLLAVGQKLAGVYRTRLPGVRVEQISAFLTAEELGVMVARRRPRQPPDQPVLGVLARWIPEKGLLELVDELAALPNRWSRLRIAAAEADAGYRRIVEDRIASLRLSEAIELAGFVDDVAAFLDSIDVLVVPSVGNEGQIFAVLEALAHGVPAVVREPALAAEYAGLPVVPYRFADDLGERLAALPDAPVPAEELARRFGPAQAVEGLRRAVENDGG